MLNIIKFSIKLQVNSHLVKQDDVSVCCSFISEKSVFHVLCSFGWTGNTFWFDKFTFGLDVVDGFNEKCRASRHLFYSVSFH